VVGYSLAQAERKAALRLKAPAVFEAQDAQVLGEVLRRDGMLTSA
jgi:hypothetical protein